MNACTGERGPKKAASTVRTQACTSLPRGDDALVCASRRESGSTRITDATAVASAWMSARMGNCATQKTKVIKRNKTKRKVVSYYRRGIRDREVDQRNNATRLLPHTIDPTRLRMKKNHNPNKERNTSRILLESRDSHRPHLR